MLKKTKLTIITLFAVLSGLLLLNGCAMMAKPQPSIQQLPQTVKSFDETPISFQVYGQGEPTLVFVHGWSCDSRYWKNQIDVFSKTNRVVTIDLAGHGHSGQSRKDYTMKSFGQDIKAVVDQIKAEKVIIIGHSMGGVLMSEAAILMPEKTIGLVGIDTIENVEFTMTNEAFEKMTEPFYKDFPSATRAFVSTMFVKDSDEKIKNWILDDMSSAPENVAMSAFKNMINLYMTQGVAQNFDKTKAPVFCINSNSLGWKTEEEINRKHMKSFEVLFMDNVGHFPMLEKPEEFNAKLKKVVETLSKSAK